MARVRDIIWTEEWRDVPDWPGYLVSTIGRVRGPRTVLRPQRDKYGYTHVPLTDRPQGRTKMALVHKLVAEAFIGPSLGLQVNHKNNVRDDNRLDNLEYLTASENSQYRRKFGTFPTGANNGNAKLTAEQVSEIRARHATGEKQKALAKEFGVSHGAIWWIVHRRTWTD